MSKRKRSRKQDIITAAVLSFIIIVSLAVKAVPSLSERIDSLFTSAGLKSDETFSGSGYVVFLDVGQGDCALVCSDNHYFLIDAGTESSGPDTVEYLQNHGIYSLDMMILSHPHDDHIGGAPEIAESLDVNQVLIGGKTSGENFDGESMEALLNVCEEKDIYVSYCNKDENFSSGGVRFSIYTARDNYSDENDWSLLTKADFGEKSFLFTGDLSAEAEESFIYEDIEADVLKVSHHGSKYSTSELFLDRVNPSAAVISVGKNNYGHPSEKVTKRLTDRAVSVFRTDVNGNIVFSTDGKSLEVNTDYGRAA